MSKEKYEPFNILSTDVRTKGVIKTVLMLRGFDRESFLARNTISSMKDDVLYYRLFTIDVDNIPIKEGCIKIPLDGVEFVNFVKQECDTPKDFFVESIEDKEKVDHLAYGYSYNYNFISKEFLVISGQRMDIKYNGENCFMRDNRKISVVEDMEKNEWSTFSGQIKFSLFQGKHENKCKPYIHLIDVTNYTTSGSLTKSVK